MTEEITINGTKYEKSKTADGRDRLRTFDNETKMWININFSNLDNNIDEEITAMLSKQYIESFR